LHGASELLRARAPIAHAALAAEGLDEAAKPSLPEGLAPEDAAPMYRDAIRRGEDPIANPLPEPPQADPTDRMSEDLKADVENGVADPLIARHVAALAPEQEQASLARQVASLRPANENEARLAISRALESEAAPVSQNLILSGDATPLEPLAQASYLEPKDFEAQTDDLEQHFADQRETALRQADADDTLPEKFHVEHDENGEHAPASETDVAREPARDFSTASRDPLDLVPVGERADGSDMRLVPREQLLAEQPRRSFLADLVDSCKN
jgi:hypothetical protein